MQTRENVENFEYFLAKWQEIGAFIGKIPKHGYQIFEKLPLSKVMGP